LQAVREQLEYCVYGLGLVRKSGEEQSDLPPPPGTILGV